MEIKMKFTNIDIILSKKLTSIIPINQIMYIDRLSSDDGVELDSTNIPIIIKSFVEQQNILASDELPTKVIDAFREYINKNISNILPSDTEKLFSICKYFDYPFKLVCRLDLDEKTELPLSDQVAYLIDNYKYNNSLCSGIYSGYAKNYDSGIRPLVMDFIERFGLSPADLTQYELDTAMKTYNIFKNEGRLNEFDDTYPIEFIKSRGMEFIIERNI